ncbi:MAG: triose-phosphate isomerase [Pelotomaculum sp.]
MRRPIIAGNWKMFKTPSEAALLAEDLKDLSAMTGSIDIVVCPPFTALERVVTVLGGSGIGVGAQDVFWEDSGAFTGEIAPTMLKDVGCGYVIIGHSERRQYFGETDEQVNRKLKAVLRHGLVPIMCVGETLQERETGQTLQVLNKQVVAGLAGLAGQEAGGMVIAYEPVWAIGTGKTASDDDAQEGIAYIRSVVREHFGAAVADAVRIQYGGSVKPGNISGLMSRPDIDGALVGGASLEAASFAAIIKAAAGQ